MMTEIPLGLPGSVYGSDMPWSVQYDEDGALIGEYRRRGVSAVVVLSPDDEIRDNTGRDLVAVYRAEGWEVIHLPIANMGVPGREDLERAIGAALEIARRGRSIAVHCHAGIGRTGLFLAVMAGNVLGLDGPSAIRFVRSYVDSAVETPAQHGMVRRILGGG